MSSYSFPHFWSLKDLHRSLKTRVCIAQWPLFQCFFVIVIVKDDHQRSSNFMARSISAGEILETFAIEVLLDDNRDGNIHSGSVNTFGRLISNPLIKRLAIAVNC